LTVSGSRARGRTCDVRRDAGPTTDPVDAGMTHEWEADRAHRLGAGLLFWCWYLPNDVVRWRSVLCAPLARGRPLFRYPLVTVPTRRVVVGSPIRIRKLGG
jgi:hypothetical protein